jgi:lysophospholipase L1-like esterase
VFFHSTGTRGIDLRIEWPGDGWVAADRVDIEPGQPPPVPPAALRIVCFGDSITQGSGYPPILERLLEERLARPVQVVNLGRSGHTSARFLEVMDRDGLLAATNPAWVLIELGTVDARVDDRHVGAADYQRNVTEVIRRARDHVNPDGTHPRVALATLPPIRTTADPFGAESPVRVEREMNPALREIGRRLDIPINDTAPVFASADALADGVHPTLATAERLAASWAQLVIEELRRAQRASGEAGDSD